MLSYFYETPKPTMQLFANPKQKITEADVPKILELLKNALEAIPEKDWSFDSIVAALEAALTASGLKKGQLLWPLRAALTGREYSPGAYEVAALLGRELTLKRLQNLV